MINKDFEEFLELLNKFNVEYLIVGGYAFAIHAIPRFTKDLDIFIRRSSENCKNLIFALNDFGFDSLDLTENDFLEPNQVIQLGNAPIRIDILTSISGVKFERAWNNKVIGTYGEQNVNFIGKEDLRTNKLSTGRNSDLEDAKKLKKINEKNK